MAHICKFENCTTACSSFPTCNEEKKKRFIGFHETKRNLWNSYRRFSYFGSIQKRINENTVYYNGTKLYNHD